MNLLLAIFGVLPLASGQFFHVPSNTLLLPEERTGITILDSDFGFSVGYQNDDQQTLVVGAPNQTDLGVVYSCPLQNLVPPRIQCTELNNNINDSNWYEAAEKLHAFNQKFYLGSSIAATKEYFLTCAPLLTKWKKGPIKGHKQDSYGECFYYENKDGQFQKITDHFLKSNQGDTSSGGLGWKTFVDELKNRILIAKSTSTIDMFSVDVAKPRDVLNSYINGLRKKTRDFMNFGEGLAAGNFLNRDERIYAANAYSFKDITDIVRFVVVDDDGSFVYNDYVEITRDAGSMFGHTLAAADLTQDGLSELLVGASAYTSDTACESGALFIYIGGKMAFANRDEKSFFIITGNNEKHRLGTALATNDVDGDGIPEIFVSAAYQETGEVHVLSGYELSIIIKKKIMTRMDLSQLKMTQVLRGQPSSAKRFGYSLQIIKDIDQNGCDELAVGSPGSNSVFIFRCLPSMKVTITQTPKYEVTGYKIVDEKANNFKVEVCIDIQCVGGSCSKVHGSLSVTNEINKGPTKTSIEKPTYEVDLQKYPKDKCQNVIVNMIKEGNGDYIYTTRLKISDATNYEIKNSATYGSWGVLSPYSELNKMMTITRGCTQLDCNPKLTMELNWTGYINEVDQYKVGSSKQEAFMITVTNNGGDAKHVFVELTVKGAAVLDSNCTLENDYYKCNVPTLTKEPEFNSFIITVQLEMTGLTNERTELEATAKLVNPLEKNKDILRHIKKTFNLNADAVVLKGSNHTLNITDKDLKNDGIYSYFDVHQFHINNKGSLTWKGLVADLKIPKQPFIKQITEISNLCKTRIETDTHHVFRCESLTLEPESSITVAASLEISKEKIGGSVSKGMLSTSSSLSIKLQPTETTLSLSLTHPLKYHKLLNIGNNKTIVIIIFVVIALLLLGLLVFGLYKSGFFKRNQKKKLAVLRESVRRRSIKRDSLNSKRSRLPSAADGNGHSDIQVLDESDFAMVALSHQPASKDNVELIEEKAQVHSS